MNRKTLIRIGIAVVVVVLFALVVWRGRSPVTTPGATETPTPTASVSLPGPLSYAAPAADWGTYTSASLAYSIRYPKEWTPNPCGPSCIAFATSDAPTELITGVTVTPGAMTDLLVQAQPYIAASQSIELNGIDWLRLTLREPQTGNIFISHFTERNGSIYELGMASTDPALLNDYASMVRSFSFLKK